MKDKALPIALLALLVAARALLKFALARTGADMYGLIHRNVKHG